LLSFSSSFRVEQSLSGIYEPLSVRREEEGKEEEEEEEAKVEM
jgi:hypothetical protein